MQAHARATAVALALAVGLVTLPAAAEVWQWTDAHGVGRYTPNPDRVPSERRGSMVKVEPGMKLPDPVPPTDPAGPSVMYAPPDEVPFDSDPFNAPEQARSLHGTDFPEPATPRPAPAPGSSPGPDRGTPVPSGAPAGAASAGAATAAVRNRATPDAPRPAPPPPPPLTAEQRSRRAELEALIAADEEALKVLISRAPNEAEDHEKSAELREIARRLPDLQAELRSLERGRSEPPAAP
jgi:hypothetical protein